MKKGFNINSEIDFSPNDVTFASHSFTFKIMNVLSIFSTDFSVLQSTWYPNKQ